MTNMRKCIVQKSAARVGEQLALLFPGCPESVCTGPTLTPVSARESSQPARAARPQRAGQGVGGGREGKGGVTGAAGFPQIEIANNRNRAIINNLPRKCQLYRLYVGMAWEWRGILAGARGSSQQPPRAQL